MGGSRDYVLVIEDDLDILEALELFFLTEGVSWRGSQGEFDVAHPPALALLDLSLGQDDIPVRLRDAGVPILITSAAVDAKEIARKIGALGCLEKPFDLPTLLRTIRQVAPAAVHGRA